MCERQDERVGENMEDGKVMFWRKGNKLFRDKGGREGGKDG